MKCWRVELVVVEFVDLISLSDSYPLLLMVELFLALNLALIYSWFLMIIIESFLSTYLEWAFEFCSLVRVELKLFEEEALDSDMRVFLKSGLSLKELTLLSSTIT